MIIAIDHGNKNMKTPHKTFTSGLKCSDLPFPLAADSLQYNGKYYMLTDERIPYMRNKTVDDRFFVLSLFAIAYELLQNSSYMPGATVCVDLAVGLAPGHFGKQYQEFERYFLGRGCIAFCFNGKRFQIVINSATAYPQGYAAVMPIYSEVRQYPRSIVIDIGGFSVDYLQLKYGKADMSVCDSLEMGVITLYNSIKSTINSAEDLLIEESDIDAVLRNELSVFGQRIKTAIEQEAANFTERLIDTLRERKIDLRSTHAIFVGGGSILLEKYISQSGKITSPDFIRDINANAVGYEVLLTKQKEAGK